ncbi:V-type sodium ATPase subunit I (plasmid) [Peptoclostridium acidaminophilum DSM 3953]|uniref:V-type sodium ATPase subunit I n=1 Tax=Peptoclostridium acidaminophilum DSM 3953 TaxID=1286171 RepID=W8T8K5_PEPAC|nr:V-type ATP synthase subunit I [Peptoclostridium acidaminophilum]AHM58034.1 V-type sodium ATPase subunit I [Peptoclostridium acidaminophilum DSM 3953]
MAVSKMQQISICSLNANLGRILELLQLQGVVELKDVSEQDSIFQRADASDKIKASLETLSLAKRALDILDQHSPEKRKIMANVSGRRPVSKAVFDDFEGRRSEAVKAAKTIDSLERLIEESRSEINKAHSRIEALSSWRELDIPLDLKWTDMTAIFIGTLPGEWRSEDIFDSFPANEPVAVDIVSASQEQTCIVAICMKPKARAILESLKQIGFSSPGNFSSEVPSKAIFEAGEEIKRRSADIQQAKSEIEACIEMRKDMWLLADYESMRIEMYEALGRLLSSKNVFVITGYVPQKYAKVVADLLVERFEAAVEVSEPEVDEDVPVLLENNGFSAPMEGVVEAFSYPGRGEADPTAVTAFFYYMFYGIMLSDAGYGLLLITACGTVLARHRATLEEHMKKYIKMFLYCGISTLFWGIMFGGYFGDLPLIISRTFLGRDFNIPPVLFEPSKSPMILIGYCMLIGVIHLYTGMGMKLYQAFKRSDYKSAVYDVLLWYILLTSLGVLLLSMKMMRDMLSLNITISDAVVSMAIALAVASAVGIIITNGRSSKNPFVRILKGFYELYGITSYFGDVLSYTRLLALGLATGIIGSVINLMAGMAAGNSIIGIVPFTLIVVLGHVLNLAINMLGAYVHTTRLHYVEYFSKFYNGGGRKFQPFAVKTKYYKFKESDDNG